ncbi:Uncharacterised protein [Bordetella pertussis]|nr:Uncharacterised protein [Bordetella pertussis]
MTAYPSATNFSSATWSCTNSTSASPRRAMSSAWPVPWATTLMSMPLAFLKAGNRCPNRPDCSVEVVEAMTMVSARAASGAASTVARPASASPRRIALRIFMVCVLP